MVDDVFQRVDELPHLPGGDPARAFRGRQGIATARSFVWSREILLMYHALYVVV